MLCDDDFGAQGGDPRRMTGGVHIDLSTCVNFYGPPPAVLERLASGVQPEDLQIHPYAAAGRMEAIYARHLGVPASQLVAGRGTTEFIWALSRRVPRESVAVPLPGYTDYLKAFPGRGFPGGPLPSIEQVDAALEAASLVIVSNPHNPTGVALDPAELVDAARRHPRTTFVVDESYVDFVADPGAATRRRRGRGEPRGAALAVEVLGHRRDPRGRRVVRGSRAPARAARPARDVADLGLGRHRRRGGDGQRRVGAALRAGTSLATRLARGAAARVARHARRARRRRALPLPHHGGGGRDRGHDGRSTGSRRASSAAPTAPSPACCASSRRFRTSAAPSPRRSARSQAAR